MRQRRGIQALLALALFSAGALAGVVHAAAAGDTPAVTDEQRQAAEAALAAYAAEKPAAATGQQAVPLTTEDKQQLAQLEIQVLEIEGFLANQASLEAGVRFLALKQALGDVPEALVAKAPPRWQRCVNAWSS